MADSMEQLRSGHHSNVDASSKQQAGKHPASTERCSLPYACTGLAAVTVVCTIMGMLFVPSTQQVMQPSLMVASHSSLSSLNVASQATTSNAHQQPSGQSPAKLKEAAACAQVLPSSNHTASNDPEPPIALPTPGQRVCLRVGIASHIILGLTGAM